MYIDAPVYAHIPCECAFCRRLHPWGEYEKNNIEKKKKTFNNAAACGAGFIRMTQEVLNALL